MDFENMDFNNNVFDIVFGLESVCHANSKEKFIKEAFRVLKNKGKILVADGFASKDYSQEKVQLSSLSKANYPMHNML
jgi:ubiquinone/menaquinone biosynthesis C-methylase UbiE